MRERRDPTKLSMLRQLPGFSAMGKGALGELASALDVVDVPAGRTLATEGRAGREIFLVVEGRAAADRGGHPIGTVGPGELIGEQAMLERRPRNATVRAVTPMRLLVAGPDSVSVLVDHLRAAASTAATLERVTRAQPVVGRPRPATGAALLGA